jgi:hypothetical protein
MVGGVLGLHLSAQPSKLTPYAKQCAYKTSTSPIPMTIEFQEDTTKTFAGGENAVPKTLRENVPGLGKTAYGMKVGGFLAVFLGTESIRITAPGATLGQLETVARDVARKLG